MTTTATDRYALALATIGLHAAGLTLEARRAEADDPDRAAHLEDKAATVRGLLLEVIYADLLDDNPAESAQARRVQALRHRGRILRDCDKKLRGGS
jgi:hypothetical protein